MSSTVSIEDTVRVDVKTSQLCCADLSCKQVEGQFLKNHITLSFVFATEASDILNNPCHTRQLYPNTSLRL